jgi:Zn-dependent M28 family amino/carboxypeptidase
MLASLAAIIFMTQPNPQDLLAQVDQARLRATVETLSSFTTRNTNSPELTNACEWIAGEFRKIPGCEVEIMRYPVTASRRITRDMEVVQVIATLKGETDDIVMMGGHIDSLNLEVDAETGRAPGANDDASGVAASLETCRILAGQKRRNTLKFVAFSGEEQGLLGSTALAKRAKAEGWKVQAVLSNDTVGSSSNLAGQKNDKQVRVFSEEGEGHHSRELARYIEWLVNHEVKDFSIKLVFRRDRFGRGGDHTPFVAEGFNAVRFVEVHEEYTRQHTPNDVIDHMDFAYLAKVTQANVSSLSSLGDARPGPAQLRVQRADNHQSHLTWKADEGTSYVVFWRDTTSPTWQGAKVVGAVGETTLDMNVDDHTFAIGSLGGIPVAQQG